MHTVILAGGQGLRLRPLTLHTPKPIVPIANRPFIFYQLDLLDSLKLSDMNVVLALSYKSDKIESLLTKDPISGITVIPSVESQPLGTAGAFKNAERFLNETTLVFNGDILTDIDLSLVLEKHKANSAMATLVLVEVVDTSVYGVIETDKRGRIKKFIEKPKRGETKSKTINAGIYLLEPEILDFIPSGVPFSFEYDVFPKLLEKKLPVYGEVMKAYWLDIGTPERYIKANFDILDGKLQCTKTPVITETGSIIDKSCSFDFQVEVFRSIIGPECKFKQNVKIRNSIILAGAQIGQDSCINNSIIGNYAEIGRNVNIIESNSIVGDNSVISDFSML